MGGLFLPIPTQFQASAVSVRTVTSWQSSAGAHRDRGLERLRNLTFATVLGASGLAAFLSVLAAQSIPGHASSPAAGSNPQPGGDVITAQDPSLNQVSQSQNQNPFAGIFGGGGGGGPVAVSGGSHP